MGSFKTGRGACSVSDDTLHIKSDRITILYRLIEFNRKWFVVLLVALSLFGISYHYGGPRTLDRLLSFVVTIGWVVLFSIVLGLVLSVLLFRSELKEGFSNLRDPNTETDFLTDQLDIPLESITFVGKTETGNPSVMTAKHLVIHVDDGRPWKPIVVSFPPGMDEERDKAIDTFEARGIPVQGDTTGE